MCMYVIHYKVYIYCLWNLNNVGFFFASAFCIFCDLHPD